jgi:hypothetical protein
VFVSKHEGRWFDFEEKTCYGYFYGLIRDPVAFALMGPLIDLDALMIPKSESVGLCKATHIVKFIILATLALHRQNTLKYKVAILVIEMRIGLS